VNEFEILALAIAAIFLVVPVAYCAISFFTHTYYPR